MSTNKPIIIEAFRRVGLSLNLHGSEDHEIKIKCLEGMEVGDWRARDADGLTPEEEAAAAVLEAIKDREQRAKEKKRARKRAAKQPNAVSDISDDEITEAVCVDEEESELRHVDSDEFGDL